MKNTGTLKVTTPTDCQIVMTRVFDAPRTLVWNAMSRPELIMRWLSGPEGWSMVVCEDDPRVGGEFRWVWRGPDGNEMTMRGVYREVVPPERIVRTESFALASGPPMGEQLVTLVLTEQRGKTSLTLTLLYASKEDRDGAIASGMEHGVAVGYDRLAQLLALAPAGEGTQAVPPCSATAPLPSGTVVVKLDPPQITDTTAQLTAIIHLTIPRAEIRNVMGPGLSELMSTIAAQGIAPAGPWFTHHLRMDPDIFDFEISVPVKVPVAAAGRVQPSQLPATKVARTVYHGDYAGLGAAWGEFSAWVAANGHKPRPDLWECYVAGPESSPDPANWRTELNRPLIE